MSTVGSNSFRTELHAMHPLLAAVPTLAQQPSGLSQMLDIPSPTPLPQPSPLVHYTLESPWVPAVALAGAGLILFFFFQHRAQLRPAAWTGATGLLLAGVLVLVANVVRTPRERVRDATSRLVGAVAQAQIPDLRALLTDDARLYYTDAGPTGLPLDALLSRVETQLGPRGAYRVDDWAIEELQAAPAGPDRVQVQVKVRVTPAGVQFPHRSWWALDWSLGPDEERCSGIRALHIQWR